MYVSVQVKVKDTTIYAWGCRRVLILVRQQTALEEILRQMSTSGMIYRSCHGEEMVQIGSPLGSKAR